MRAGAPWRLLSTNFPPWPIVYQQTQRWVATDSFEALAHDRRLLVRLLAGRTGQPSAVILDARTLQSSSESGARAEYDGHKRRNGSKAHLAVDTLGHLLALVVTAANEQERAQVTKLARQVQEMAGAHVTLAYVDQGYIWPKPAAAAEQGIHLAVVELEEAKHGFVLLSRRWGVERGFAWTARFRRPAHGYGRLPAMLAGLHFLAFACLILHQFIHPAWNP